MIDIIDPAWRPDEYDHAQLMFVPASRRAQAQCVRPGCTQIAVRRTLCIQCRREKWLSGMDTEEFAQIPVTGERAVYDDEVPRRLEGPCRPACAALTATITAKAAMATSPRQRARLDRTVHQPGGAATRKPCIVPGCDEDRQYRNGLCSGHQAAGLGWITRWNEAGRQPHADFDLWLARKAEPFHQPSGVALSKLGAVPFGLMDGTAGLELIAALQNRDAEGWLNFDPRELRHLFQTSAKAASARWSTRKHWSQPI